MARHGASNPYESKEQLELSPAQEARLLYQVVQEYTTDRDNRGEWAAEMATLHRQWQSGRGPERVTSPWPGASNVDVPMTRIAIEGLHASLFAGYFTQKPFIRFRESRELEAFIEWEIDREMDARPIFDEYLLNCAIYGTAIGRVIPTRNRKGKLKLRVENISNIDDFFIADGYCGPRAVNEAHHLGLRSNLKVWECLEHQRDGIFKNVEPGDGKAQRQSGSNDSVIEAEKLAFEKLSGMTMAYSDMLQNEVSVVEWYTKFQVGGEDGSVDPLEAPIDIIVWANIDSKRKLYRVVRNEQNVRPFFHSVLYPVPGRFYGVGVPKVLKQVQEQLNLVHNMRNDAGQIAIQPWAYYQPSSGFKPNEVKVGPGKHIPVDDPNSVQVVKPMQLPTHFFEEEKILVGYSERLTGVGDLVLGQGIQGAGTATGVRSILQQGSLRMDVIMLRIGWGLRDFVLHTIRWNKMLRDDDVKVRVIGTVEDVTLNKGLMSEWDEDYVPPFDVNSLTGNRGAERELAMLLHDKLMMNPLVAQDPKALFGAVQFLCAMFGIKRPELLLPTTYFEMERQQRMQSNAAQENEKMAQGSACEVDWYDDDAEHLAQHSALLRAAPDAVKPIVRAHMNQHSYNARMKQMGAATGSLPHMQIPQAAQAPGAAGGGSAGGRPGAAAPFAPGPGPESGGSGMQGLSASGAGDQIGGLFPTAIKEMGRVTQEEAFGSPVG